MSTELYPEQKESPASDRWRAPTEVAPSRMREAEPKLIRFIGMVSASCLVLGAFVIGLHVYGRPVPFGAVWGPIAAAALLLLGTGGVLFHAAQDKDEQV